MSVELRKCGCVFIMNDEPLLIVYTQHCKYHTEELREYKITSWDKPDLII